MNRAFYSDSISNFLTSDIKTILSTIELNNDFPSELTQRDAPLMTDGAREFLQADSSRIEFTCGGSIFLRRVIVSPWDVGGTGLLGDQ